MTSGEKIAAIAAGVVGTLVGTMVYNVIKVRREQKSVSEQVTKNNKELDRLNSKLNSMTSQIK